MRGSHLSHQLVRTRAVDSWGAFPIKKVYDQDVTKCQRLMYKDPVIPIEERVEGGPETRS
jgi:hypothetical protein